MNSVKDDLKSGKTVVGTGGSVFEDNMAMLADSGLDFILFDSQHAVVEVKPVSYTHLTLPTSDLV